MGWTQWRRLLVERNGAVMFKLRMIAAVPGGKLHLLGYGAAAVRGYSSFDAECGRRVKVGIRKVGEPCIPVGLPYDPNEPRLCRACVRLAVVEEVSHD